MGGADIDTLSSPLPQLNINQLAQQLQTLHLPKTYSSENNNNNNNYSRSSNRNNITSIANHQINSHRSFAATQIQLQNNNNNHSLNNSSRNSPHIHNQNNNHAANNIQNISRPQRPHSQQSSNVNNNTLINQHISNNNSNNRNNHNHNHQKDIRSYNNSPL